MSEDFFVLPLSVRGKGTRINCILNPTRLERSPHECKVCGVRLFALEVWVLLPDVPKQVERLVASDQVDIWSCEQIAVVIEVIGWIPDAQCEPHALAIDGHPLFRLVTVGLRVEAQFVCKFDSFGSIREEMGIFNLDLQPVQVNYLDWPVYHLRLLFVVRDFVAWNIVAFTGGADLVVFAWDFGLAWFHVGRPVAAIIVEHLLSGTIKGVVIIIGVNISSIDELEFDRYLALFRLNAVDDLVLALVKNVTDLVAKHWHARHGLN